MFYEGFTIMIFKVILLTNFIQSYRVFTQIRFLFWRNFLDAVRDPLNLKLTFIQSLVSSPLVKKLSLPKYQIYLPHLTNFKLIGILYGLIFFKLDLTQEGVMNINGVLFISIVNTTFGSLFAVINTFPKEIPLFIRESQSGM